MNKKLFAAAALAAEQDTLAVRDSEVDVVHALASTMLTAIVEARVISDTAEPV